MSEETSNWLNTLTLIGFTETRGNAWHYRESAQGDRPNHYVGAIPVEDVRERLFYWKPKVSTINVVGVGDKSWKAICRPARTFGDDDKGEIFDVPRQSYAVHEYDKWLISHVESIVDDNLAIGSAGLLRGGAVAWVQIELPDTIKMSCGVEFRPFITSATSLNGALATTYNRGVTHVVCDNTLAAAMGDAAQQIKIRHSKNSAVRIGEARAALDVIFDVADAFQESVDQLTNTTVTDEQWQHFLEAHVTLADEPTARAKTLVEQKRKQLDDLYRHDPMVQPWAGSAFGVVQAVNTWAHHSKPVKGDTSRAQRNAWESLTGKFEQLDHRTLDTLMSVR